MTLAISQQQQRLLSLIVDPQANVVPGIPETAICVQDIAAQYILQFAIVIALCCALHRSASRVIHRSEWFNKFSFWTFQCISNLLCLFYFHYKRAETNINVMLGRRQLVFAGTITSHSYVQARLLPWRTRQTGTPTKALVTETDRYGVMLCQHMANKDTNSMLRITTEASLYTPASSQPRE